MIKYIGSKRLLLPHILEAVHAVAETGDSVLDPFSGTARVAHALKTAGFDVVASDHNAYAATIARCYVQADARANLDELAELVDQLNAVPTGTPGWFTRQYAQESRYFRPDNAARIESVRRAIDRLAPPDTDLHACLLTSLIEAADRVDSTTGLQMAYLKTYSPRSANPLALRVPRLPAGAPDQSCAAHRLDCFDAARAFSANIAYLDPPYNQHSYRSNYHVWETLTLFDRPATYGVANKRVDCRTVKSPFNRRSTIAKAMAELVDAIDADTLIVSFNDEGFLSREQLESILQCRGPVRTLATAHPRYVGAKIGIHNREGKKVGAVSHTTNREFIFVAGKHAERIEHHQLAA